VGGTLVLKAAQLIHEVLLAPPQAPAARLAAAVLVCSALPSDCAGGAGSPAHEPFPALVRWSNSSCDSTRDSIPDGDEEIWKRPRDGATSLAPCSPSCCAAGHCAGRRRMTSYRPASKQPSVQSCAQRSLSTSPCRMSALLLSTRAPQVARIAPPIRSLSPAN